MQPQPIHHYPGKDRRQAVRMPYRTRITYANRNRTCIGKVRDISFDGLFFETPQVLAVGDQIDMGFRFRHTNADLAIVGEIRHASPQGVGVRLLW
jgi:hypothetical protein